MKIIRTQPSHATILANYYAANEAHLQRWSPRVPPGHHSVEAWEIRLSDRDLEFQRGQAVHFIGTDDEESEVIGACSVSSIIRGVFQAGHLGYSCAERYQGQGLMKRIVSHTIDYAFSEMRLHRLMANYMPDNARSGRLLASLGFEREGYAKSFLLIDGKWEDHVLTSLVNTDG